MIPAITVLTLFAPFHSYRSRDGVNSGRGEEIRGSVMDRSGWTGCHMSGTCKVLCIFFNYLNQKTIDDPRMERI